MDTPLLNNCLGGDHSRPTPKGAESRRGRRQQSRADRSPPGDKAGPISQRHRISISMADYWMEGLSSSFHHPGCIMPQGMRQMKTWVVVALSCLTAAYGQTGSSSDVPFAGCYEVVSLAWSPPDETIKFIPKRFQLLYETGQPARTILSVRAVPFTLSDPLEKFWTWKLKG